MSTSGCPSRDVLTGLLLGRLNPADTAAVSEHVKSCSQCEVTVQDLKRSPDSTIGATKNSAASSAPGGSGAVVGLKVDALLQAVVAYQLLSDEDQRQLEAKYPAERRGEDAQSLVRELVQNNKLTKYQGAALYQGKAKGLSIGPYLVLDRLGVGGMGQVLKALDRRSQQIIAIKVLAPGATRSPEAVKRFQREAQAAIQLNHPHIVRAFEAGDYEGQHYLAMELIEGTDLANLLKKQGPLPFQQAYQYILQAAQGLESAHAQGIIHRDIKPGNLMLNRDGIVKISDMGLARLNDPSATATTQAAEGLTQTGQVMGTVDYMAPEQALQTKSADARSDIYSLGCTFYRLVTGEIPYQGDSMVEKILAHREQPIPSMCAARSEVPQAVDHVLQRMLAKKPDDRQASMSVVVDELRRCLSDPDSIAAPEIKLAPVVSRSTPSTATDDVAKGFVLSETSTSNRRQPKSRVGLYVAAVGVLLIGGVVVLLTRPFEDKVVELAGSGSAANEVTSASAPTSSPPTPVVAPAKPTIAPDDTVSRIESSSAKPAALPSVAPPVPKASVSLAPSTSMGAPTTSASPTTNPSPSSSALPPTTVSPVSSPSPTTPLPPTTPMSTPSPTTVATNSVPELPTTTPTVTPTVPLPEEPSRLKVPDDAAQGEVRKLIREIYKAEYASLKKPEEKIELAKKLLAQVTNSPDDNAGRFVMLTEVATLAADGADASLVETAAGQVAAIYDVERMVWLADVWEAAQKRPLPSAGCKLLTPGLLKLVDEAVENDDYTVASRLMDTTLAYARKAQDPALLKLTVDRSKQLVAQRQLAEQLAKASEALADTPDDPAANLLLGRHHCFTLGEWEEGFPLLAKSNDPVLKELGEKSAAAPTEGSELLALADLWWTKAEKATKERRELQLGALYWYQAAQAKVTGLEKTKVDKRIADATAATAELKSTVRSSKPRYIRVPLTTGVEITFRLIPAGSFVMGSPPNEPMRAITEVQHRVTLTKPYYLGVTEVTQAQWQAVTGSTNSSWINVHPQAAAHYMTYSGMKNFINRLNDSPAGQIYRFRLPTEAEWEYAARAGTTTAFYFGPDSSTISQYEWVGTAETNGGTVHPVAQLKPNPWGLYDMLGNVTEPCSDWYSTEPYKPNPVIDPTGPQSSDDGAHAMRGGSFDTSINYCRIARRLRLASNTISRTYGLRLVCEVVGKLPPNAAVPGFTPVRATTVSSTTTSVTPGTPVTPPANPAPTSSPASAQTPEAHRRLAEFIFSRNGNVQVYTGTTTWRYVNTSADLPSGVFRLRGVSVSNTPARFSDADLAALENFDSLEHLSFSYQQFSDAGFARLRNLTNLQSLHLDYCHNISDASLAVIKNFTRLTALTFLQCQGITPAGVQQLNSLTNLSSFTVPPCVTDVNLGIFKNFSALRTLTLTGTAISNNGLAQLASLPLTTLYLSSTQISDAGILHLKNMTNLKSLYLNGSQVSGPGLANLPQQLTYVSLSGSLIDDASMQFISRLSGLTGLNVYGSRISDAGLARITGLPNLQSLMIYSNQNLTGSGLAQVQLPSLRTLDIGSSSFNDAAVRNLARFPLLTTLYLTNTQVTDNGIGGLSVLSNMRNLYVGSTISDATMQKLQQAMPNCKINR